MIPSIHNVYDVLEMVLDKEQGSLVAQRLRQEPWTWEDVQEHVKKQEHPKMFHVLPRYINGG